MRPRTCVTPFSRFVYGIHQPAYAVANLREKDAIQPLGAFANGDVHDNRRNFPAGDVQEPAADWVFEIPNALPFRGVTYINKAWADRAAADPAAIFLPAPPTTSMTAVLEKLMGRDQQAVAAAFAQLPGPVCLTLAATATDPRDLVALAGLACDFVYGPGARKAEPVGLLWEEDSAGRQRPRIHDHDLFEALANNPQLPGHYKEIMVLRPGAQGHSEIVGEVQGRNTHVFEYLRRNSYIPWGHYAANMANDAPRYQAANLQSADMAGLRHLYYQRTYVRLAAMLEVPLLARWRSLDAEALEQLRQEMRQILVARPVTAGLEFDASLWGWNYGFDCAPSGYRLHASHQQIHQQYAMLPATVAAYQSDERPESIGAIPAYGCGDLVAELVEEYRQAHSSDFFSDYLLALRNNHRLDRDQKRERGLIVYEDAHVVLFVPKAQVSQWELQLMPLGPVGNILEADAQVRAALDRGLLLAIRILAAMGARMVTSIEYSKRFTAGDTGQRLLYSLLPKLPWAPGAFSEAELRFICGHYPEDFASACRDRLAAVRPD